MSRIKNFFLGKPLKYGALNSEKLSTFWGLPIMASDAVSSVAYACEEIMLVLVPIIGLGAYKFVPSIGLPIIMLLIVLAFSYSQIIDHYPNGGGAYTVSKENLGRGASYIAASALIIDYILTVAVSISSSTAAIVSAFPELTEFKVLISIVFVIIITVVDLRGISESARAFSLPIYMFIFCMGIMIVVGIFRFMMGELEAITYSQQTLEKITPNITNTIGIVVLLRAFSSGCSALTGVEAVSNAIPNFKEPAQKNAKRILYLLCGIIVFIFGGTIVLEYCLKAIPYGEAGGPTLISQLAHAVFGKNIMYYLIQVFTSIILILAANTAYNGLPMLLYNLAHDGNVPRQFAHRGAKLSFSNGIIFISICSILLILMFDADTHRLIPLYSVGVFISFTLSQLGMFIRWRRKKEKGWQYKSWINGVGAVITAVTLVVVLVNKFTHGAWILFIAMPLIIVLMNQVHKYYDKVAKELELKEINPIYRKHEVHSTQAIVLVSSINKSLLKSLNYANTISDNVSALHICRHPEHANMLREQWENLGIEVPLIIVETPYNDIIEPLNDYLTNLENGLQHGESISIILVKFMTKKWYERLLNNETTYFIEHAVSKRKSVSVIILPFHFK